MARNWVRLPSYSSKEEAERYVPPGWEVFQIEDLYDQLPVGKRFEQKTSFPIGTVPVIDQSESGIVGYHNEDPGVTASPENPVVTFANHTCEMRMMTEPFSVIQNVFPLIGRAGVCRTKFFYYLTKGRVWLEEYKGHFPEFRRKWVCCPPEVEQERLEKILCSFDSKIDLNRRINQTLEAMAQAIFKSWFVDFDPVKARIAAIEQGQDPLRAAMRAISGKTDAELDQMPREHHHQLATTAALFPDAMEDSVLGEIPKGWKVKPLDQIASYLNGLALQKFPPESEDEYLPVIKIAQLRAGYASGADRASKNIKPEYIVQDGDVLFSWSGSLEVDVWTGGAGALNQHLFKVTSDNVPKWFYYFATKHYLPHFREIAANKATTMGHIQRKHLSDAKIAMPLADVIKAATEIIDPIFRKMIEMRLQSNQLAELRDTLLPKLLSGELSVENLHKEVAV